MSIHLVSFGCRLNGVEGEQARAAALADGLGEAVIFNTCAVTGEAVRQARQAIRRARRERPDATLVVTGCAAQIDPAGFAAMPEVDRVIGQPLKTAPGAYRPDAPRVQIGDWAAPRPAPPFSDAPARAREWVAVQTGCDHRCTFCVIPYGRGPSRSVPAGEVVAAVRGAVARGAGEVVLTGVDLTAWGADLPGGPRLGGLVRRVLRLVPELPRLRLSSVDSAEVDAELLACFGEEARLAPYLHLSLQSGDDLILKRMKRRHGRDDALRLVEAIRRARPDTAFGADLIAGFPTETDDAFGRTLSLVEEAGLAFVHAFPFSPRPGTPAARMPPLRREAVKARADRLREAGAAALARHLDAQVGRTVDALVESSGLARAPDFTEVAFEGDAAPGAMLALTITSHDGRRAKAAPLSPPGRRG